MILKEYIIEPDVLKITEANFELQKDAFEAIQQYGKTIVITLSVEKKKRSTKANAYYWSAVFPHLQKCLRGGETSQN